MKKFGSSANLEQSSLISQLYTIYQGTVATPGKRTQQQLNPKETRTPASLRLRLRLIPYFIKSTQAANTFPSSVQVGLMCVCVLGGVDQKSEVVRMGRGRTVCVMCGEPLCVHACMCVCACACVCVCRGS